MYERDIKNNENNTKIFIKREREKK